MRNTSCKKYNLKHSSQNVCEVNIVNEEGEHVLRMRILLVIACIVWGPIVPVFSYQEGKELRARATNKAF